MTHKELSQLYWLNREIEQDKRKLEEFRARATSTVGALTGMPHAGSVADKTALAAEIAYLEGEIQRKARQTLYEYERLTEYINGVDDSLMRQILTLRYIDGKTWAAIAMAVGGNNTADGVRKTLDRFLAKN